MPSIDDAKCVLITGATSGIGRALALEIAKLPSKPKVIAAGRRKDRLEKLSQAGLETVSLELGTDLATLKKSVGDLIERYPDLDAIILNAGIQHHFDYKKEVDFIKFAEELNINYTSIVAFASFVLPHFLELSKQGHPSFIITVTSGLGIVPGPWVPNYSATKAAVRSFTYSLRAQLHDTNVRVLEIIPPLVESELHDPYGISDKLSRFWMPLDEYTKTTLQGLREGKDHICAGLSQTLVDKYEQGKAEMVLHSQKNVPWE